MGFKSHFRVLSGDNYVAVDLSACPLQRAQTDLPSMVTLPLKKKSSDSTLQSNSSKASNLTNNSKTSKNSKGGKLAKLKFDIMKKIHARKDSGAQGESEAADGSTTATTGFPIPLHPSQAGAAMANMDETLPEDLFVSYSVLNACCTSLTDRFKCMNLHKLNSSVPSLKISRSPSVPAIQRTRPVSCSCICSDLMLIGLQRMGSFTFPLAGAADTTSTAGDSLAQEEGDFFPVIEPETYEDSFYSSPHGSVMESFDSSVVGSFDDSMVRPVELEDPFGIVKRPVEQVVVKSTKRSIANSIDFSFNGSAKDSPEGSTHTVLIHKCDTSLWDSSPLSPLRDSEQCQIAQDAISKPTKESQLRKFFWDLAYEAAKIRATECETSDETLMAIEFFDYLGEAIVLKSDDVMFERGSIKFRLSEMSNYDWIMLARIQTLKSIVARLRADQIDPNEAEDLMDQLFPQEADHIMGRADLANFLNALVKTRSLSSEVAANIKAVQMSVQEFEAEHKFVVAPFVPAPRRVLRTFFELPLRAGARVNKNFESTRYLQLLVLIEAATFGHKEWRDQRYNDAEGSFECYYKAYEYTSQGLKVPASLMDNVRDWSPAEQRLLRRGNAVLKLRQEVEKRSITDPTILTKVRQSLIECQGDLELLEIFLYHRACFESTSGLKAIEIPEILILHPDLDKEIEENSNEKQILCGLMLEASSFVDAEVRRKAELEAAKKAFKKSKFYIASLSPLHITNSYTGKGRFERVKDVVKKLSRKEKETELLLPGMRIIR
jgi:hypothetical protein